MRVEEDLCKTCCYRKYCEDIDDYRTRAEELDKMVGKVATDVFTPILRCFYREPIMDKKED